MSPLLHVSRLWHTGVSANGVYHQMAISCYSKCEMVINQGNPIFRQPDFANTSFWLNCNNIYSPVCAAAPKLKENCNNIYIMVIQ